jgi:DNA polymerase-3 subunit gamma/tau
MLSTPAFNALLKTIEEPPEHVVFMLLTTEKQKLPQTVLSRCQFFQFKMISKDDMIRGLYSICMKEFIIYDDGVLEMIADKSDGAMRDAITMLEQCVSLGKNHVTKQVVRDMLGEPEEESLENLFTFIKASRVNDAIDEIDEMYYSGIRPYAILESFFEHVMNKVKRSASSTFMTRLLRITAETMSVLKTVRQDSKVSLEVAVVKMCIPETETDIGSVLLRIQKLERNEKPDSGVTANAVDPNEFMVIRLACNPLKTVVAM